MLGPYHYNTVRHCSVCQRDTLHAWHSTGSFKGKWTCSVCEQVCKLGDALSDVAKASAKFRDDRISNG